MASTSAWHKERFEEDEVERLLLCDLCEAPTQTATFLFRKYGLAVERCARCGLIYVNPRLRQDILWQRYADDYFQYEYLPQHGEYDEQQNFRSYAPLLETIERLCGKRGRLFEFGAALGLFLAAARKAGWEVAGNELSQFAASYARQRFDIAIIAGAAETLELPIGEYDAVTMFETLEHVRSPRTVLSQAARLLRPGGILALSTPNIGGLSWYCLRERWWIVAPREHIFYFSPRTIRHALSQAGFRVLRIESVGTDLHFFCNTLLGRTVMPKHIRDAAPQTASTSPASAMRRPSRMLWQWLEPRLVPLLQQTVHRLKLADTLLVYAERKQ